MHTFAYTLVAIKGSRTKSHRLRAKGSSFATAAATVEKTLTEHKVEDGNLPEKTCLYCKGGHMLVLCTLLEKRAQSEKTDFLKKTGICFGCLCGGHISIECRKHLSCKTCGLRHPSILHIHHKDKGVDVEKGKSNSESAVGSSLVTVQTSTLQ